MSSRSGPSVGSAIGHASTKHASPSGAFQWRSRRPGRISTLAGIGTTVATVLPVFLVGGLSVQLGEDTGLSQSMLGVVVAVYWAVSAMFSSFAGILSVWFGSRWGMSCAALIGGISLLGIAVLTPTWHWLIAWLALAGVANAMGHPPSNALIGTGVASRNRAFAYGIKQGAIPLATFCAGLAVPTLGLTVGWQWTFVVAGAVTAFVLAFVVWQVPPLAEGVRFQRRADNRQRLPRDLRVFLVLASTASGLGAAQSNVIGAFTVSAATEVGFAAASAGLLLSLGSLANIIARPLVGWIADRGVGGTMTTVALMMASGAFGLFGMALAIPWTFAIGCVLAFGLGWGWSGLLHYVVSHAAGSAAARATGLVQAGAYIGSAAGPFVLGFVFEEFGATIGWVIAACVAGAAALAALAAAALHPDRRRARRGE